MPLCRQSRILARHSLEISRSTLAGWVGAACWWLEVLHERLAAHVLASDRLFADDALLPVLDPGRGRTRTGRLWTYTRDDRAHGDTAPPAVLFRYEPDRKGERPAKHLRNFRGVLRWMATLGSRAWPAADGSFSPRAGRTPAGSSSNCTRRVRPWPPRQYGGSASSTRSSARSGGSRRMTDGEPGRSGHGPSSRRCTAGCRISYAAYQPGAAGGGDPLRAWALDGADSVPRRWPDRARHQSGGAGDPAGGARSQEQPVCRI